MEEFTFDTSDMSNITLYTAENTTFNTSDMSNINLYKVLCESHKHHFTTLLIYIAFDPLLVVQYSASHLSTPSTYPLIFY